MPIPPTCAHPAANPAAELVTDLLEMIWGYLHKAKKNNSKQTNITNQQQNPDIGTPEWRRQNAKKAADARHDQPVGGRDKQRLIREIWATGKYKTRDICAEQECAALDMSFSAARKALINTADP